MEAPGLEEAIKAAGNQAKLADAIGRTQQLVSLWSKGKQKISAEDAIRIEAATGVSKALLRPDLFGSAMEPAE